MTPEDLKNDTATFANGFADDLVRSERSEDEVFTPMEQPGDAPMDGDVGSEVAIIIAPEAEGGPSATGDGAEAAEAEAASDPNAEPAAAEPAPDAAEGAVDEAMGEGEPALDVAKETQRLKSWEGRLKARERELTAKEQALSESAGAPAGEAEPAGMAPDGDNEAGEPASEAAAEDEDGKVNEMLARIRSDFGDDFVDDITLLATHIAKQIAGEQSGSVRGEIQAIVDDINGFRADSHFRELKRAHPDYETLANSPEFAAWVTAMPDAEREAVAQTVDAGSVDDVIDVLNRFKAASAAPAQGGDELPPPDSAEGDALDNAEAVPGGAMSLPETPAGNDDYAAAWDKFN